MQFQTTCEFHHFSAQTQESLLQSKLMQSTGNHSTQMPSYSTRDERKNKLQFMKLYQNSRLMHLASLGKRIIYKAYNGSTIVLNPTTKN